MTDKFTGVMWKEMRKRVTALLLPKAVRTFTLAGNRGLMLVGEPGTAKTMLSELLSALVIFDSSGLVRSLCSFG